MLQNQIIKLGILIMLVLCLGLNCFGSNFEISEYNKYAKRNFFIPTNDGGCILATYSFTDNRALITKVDEPGVAEWETQTTYIQSHKISLHGIILTR